MKKYVFFALISLVACNKDKDDDKDNGPALMPMAIGNKWVYDFKVYDDNGMVIGTEPNDTVEVFKKGTLAGYFSIEEDDSEQWFSSATEIKGHVLYGSEPDWKLLKSAKIDTFSTVTDSDGYKYVRIAYPDQLQVLTFNNCFKNEVLTQDPGGFLFGKDVYYISPGVGIVRQEFYYSDFNGGWILDYREDLLSYTLK
jgi:hypothetical protein